MDDTGELADDAVRLHRGFQNPAAERFDGSSRLALSLDAALIRHPSSTYLFRISGGQWERYGVFDRDMALVDRALAPRPRDLVVFWEDDYFIIHRYAYLPDGTEIWGVVSAIIHRYREDAEET